MPTLVHTALIVPALTDQAGQCRIVMRTGRVRDALKDYRASPDPWKEVGIMNSQGKLVCCEDVGDLRQQLQECEPLMAGLTLEVAVEDDFADITPPKPPHPKGSGPIHDPWGLSKLG